MEIIKLFNLTDLLFNHSKQELALASSFAGRKLYTGGVVREATRFSTCREPANTSPVKLSGATKLLDYLLPEKSAAIYDGGSAIYIEFATKEGSRYHLMAKKEKISFVEETTPFRFHNLFAFLAIIMLMDPGRFNFAISDLESVCEFTDDFYFFCKAMGLMEMNVTCGDTSILEEIKAGFRSGLFSDENKVGEFSSEFELSPEEKTKDEEKEKEEEPEDVLWESIKSGKYTLDYEWSPRQKEAILPLSFLEGYSPDAIFFNTFKIFEEKLAGALKGVKKGSVKGDRLNLFLLGRPGTGKTYMLHALSAAFGLPIRTVPMSRNTEEDTFQGTTSIVEGKITEADTPFITNAEEGGLTVIEEINLANPDVVMGAIGQFVEYPYELTKHGRERITRHPLNIVCGTMNIGTAGSKEVSEALSSRFSITIVMDDPEKEDFINRLRAEGYKKKNCLYVYKVYTAILDALKSPDFNCEEFSLSMSFRSCLAALELIEMGFSPKEAIRNTMVGKVAEHDLQIGNRIWTEIVEPMAEL